MTWIEAYKVKTSHLTNHFFVLPDTLSRSLGLSSTTRFALHVLRIGILMQREYIKLTRRVHHVELYLPGVFLNHHIGSNLFIRATARVIVLARIICTTCEEIALWQESIQRLKIACSWDALSLQYVQSQISEESWIYKLRVAHPSLFLGTASVLIFRMCVIVNQCILMLQRLMKIGLCLVEFSDTVWLEQADESRVVDDIFIETYSLYKKVQSDLDHLSRILTENGPLVNKTLQLVGIQKKAEDLSKTIGEWHANGQNIATSVEAGLQYVIDMSTQMKNIANSFVVLSDVQWKEQGI